MNFEGRLHGLECQIVEAGWLRAASGRIVASDPLVFFDEKPFVREIPPGAYQVLLAVVKIDGYDRVAFAKLKVSENEPESWESAARTWSGSRRDGGEIGPYSVDSGTGCFMDSHFQDSFNQFQFSEYDSGNHNFPADLPWRGSVSAQYVDFSHEPSEGNLIMFSSGFGDGGYSTYVGLDSNGLPTAFVTDFDLLEDRSL